MISLPILPDNLEETQSGIALRLLSIHFGAGQSFPPPSTSCDRVFRWEKPRSVQDCIGGVIGSRSTLWFPRGFTRPTEFGPEGRDFGGGGRPQDEEDEWQL